MRNSSSFGGGRTAPAPRTRLAVVVLALLAAGALLLFAGGARQTPQTLSLSPSSAITGTSATTAPPLAADVRKLQDDVTALRQSLTALASRVDALPADTRRLVETQLHDQGVEEQGRLLLRVSERLKQLSDANAGAQPGSAKRRSSVQEGEDRPNKPHPAATTPAAAADFSNCALNPSLHYEATGQRVLECPSEEDGHDPEASYPRRAYCLSLPGQEEAFEERRLALAKHGITLARLEAVNGHEAFAAQYGSELDAASGKLIKTYTTANGTVLRSSEPGFLTAGERGYLASMRKLFATLLDDPTATNVMVIDDDAVFACDFEHRMQAVLRHPRCGSFLGPGTKKGGLLLLGAAIWIDGTFPDRGPYCAGWELVRWDLQQAKLAQRGFPLCFNANSKTFGSFGVVYHRDTFRAIIDWIDHASKPFDHIYPDLARLQ